MRSTIFVQTVEISVIFLITVIAEPKRPAYRLDYRYEKAFDTFYKLHKESLTWHEAKIRCEAESTALAIPETLDEVESMVILITEILLKYTGVFIGIHDFYSERTFVTLDGNPFDHSLLDLLWEKSEPLYGAGRCLALRRNGKLYVHPCTQPLPFICKIKAADITHYPDCNTYDPRWILGPNSTCYMTHFEQQTWGQAYSTCQLAGGHLTIINSRQEADHIRSLFKAIDGTKEGSLNDDFAFLGFSDLFQRYHYRTIFGNHLYREADWDIKCPEVSALEMSNRCGGIKRSGLLTTGSCKVPAVFFCEKLASEGFRITANTNDNTTQQQQ